MTKTLPEYFRDWEGSTFGYGYGTGEEHTLPVLRQFMEACPAHDSYDHHQLEAQIGPAVTWLLINTLARADILEYGTSPRFGWLTRKGQRLQAFVLSRSDAELYEIVCNRSEGDTICYPDACNCGPGGYEEDRVCDNPFWRDP